MKKTVLIVEDNLLFRCSLEKILPKKYTSLDFVFAGSADSAKQKIEKLSKLYCLVTDYNLGAGQLNGIQLAEEIRNKFPNVKVILISSHIENSLKVKAYQHGIYDCVSKFDDLYEWIKLIGL